VNGTSVKTMVPSRVAAPAVERRLDRAGGGGEAVRVSEDDPYRLHRFVDAQDDGRTYAHALGELRDGNKRSHWMWFVFPQVAGLGRSSMAQAYAISGLDEARAYLAHPVLGARLRESAGVLASGAGTDPERIFGAVDALKLRSSMTLFAHAAPEEAVFRTVLDRFFAGAEDDATLARLR
jgi:uncharacterized protein (DUF1810 family)